MPVILKIQNHNKKRFQEIEDSFNLKSFIGQDYFIDDQHSYIGFKIKYFGFSPVRGRFNDFVGTLFYNPSNISNLSVSISMEVNSINTGNKRRDEDLKREGTWFDATTFPIISFSSTKVIPRAKGEFDLIGVLTLKGISRVDTFSFQKPTDLSKDWAGNDQVDFSGKIIIDRQDFKVFGGDFWSSVMENGLTQLSDEVEIEIDIHSRKADYQIRYDTADSLSINKLVLDTIKQEGIDSGMAILEDLFQDNKLSAGKLSSIGYTLNTWKMHPEAFLVFKKRMEYFPEKITTWNQLGITNLLMNNFNEASANFERVLKTDSTDSRALEYLKLIKDYKSSEDAGKLH